MKEGIIYLNFHFNPIFAYAFFVFELCCVGRWIPLLNVTVLLAWKNSKEEENLCLRSYLVFCKKSEKP